MPNDDVRRHHDRVYAETRAETQGRRGGERAVAAATVETRAAAARDQHAASGGSTTYADYLKTLDG